MPLSIFNAVKANNLDEVQRYFAGNGLPDIITSYEYDSLLHVAVRNGASIDVIKTLARYVNIDQRNAWGETALHLACIQERFDVIEVVRLLLRWGSDINAQNINGETPLHWSSAHGKLDVVKFLVTHGANVDNSTTRELLTPLHTAVQNRHMAVVSCLLSSNASPDSRDVYHRTPRMLAKQNGFDEIVALIDSYIPPESESESAAKQEADISPTRASKNKSRHISRSQSVGNEPKKRAKKNDDANGDSVTNYPKSRRSATLPNKPSKKYEDTNSDISNAKADDDSRQTKKLKSQRRQSAEMSSNSDIVNVNEAAVVKGKPPKPRRKSTDLPYNDTELQVTKVDKQAHRSATLPNEFSKSFSEGMQEKNGGKDNNDELFPKKRLSKQKRISTEHVVEDNISMTSTEKEATLKRSSRESKLRVTRKKSEVDSSCSQSPIIARKDATSKQMKDFPDDDASIKSQPSSSLAPDGVKIKLKPPAVPPTKVDQKVKKSSRPKSEPDYHSDQSEDVKNLPLGKPIDKKTKRKSLQNPLPYANEEKLLPKSIKKTSSDTYLQSRAEEINTNSKQPKTKVRNKDVSMESDKTEIEQPKTHKTLESKENNSAFPSQLASKKKLKKCASLESSDNINTSRDILSPLATSSPAEETISKKKFKKMLSANYFQQLSDSSVDKNSNSKKKTMRNFNSYRPSILTSDSESLCSDVPTVHSEKPKKQKKISETASEKHQLKNSKKTPEELFQPVNKSSENLAITDELIQSKKDASNQPFESTNTASTKSGKIKRKQKAELINGTDEKENSMPNSTQKKPLLNSDLKASNEKGSTTTLTEQIVSDQMTRNHDLITKKSEQNVIAANDKRLKKRRKSEAVEPVVTTEIKDTKPIVEKVKSIKKRKSLSQIELNQNGSPASDEHKNNSTSKSNNNLNTIVSPITIDDNVLLHDDQMNIEEIKTASELLKKAKSKNKKNLPQTPENVLMEMLDKDLLQYEQTAPPPIDLEEIRALESDLSVEEMLALNDLDNDALVSDNIYVASNEENDIPVFLLDLSSNSNSNTDSNSSEDESFSQDSTPSSASKSSMFDEQPLRDDSSQSPLINQMEPIIPSVLNNDNTNEVSHAGVSNDSSSKDNSVPVTILDNTQSSPKLNESLVENQSNRVHGELLPKLTTTPITANKAFKEQPLLIEKVLVVVTDASPLNLTSNASKTDVIISPITFLQSPQCNLDAYRAKHVCNDNSESTNQLNENRPVSSPFHVLPQKQIDPPYNQEPVVLGSLPAVSQTVSNNLDSQTVSIQSITSCLSSVTEKSSSPVTSASFLWEPQPFYQSPFANAFRPSELYTTSSPPTIRNATSVTSLNHHPQTWSRTASARGPLSVLHHSSSSIQINTDNKSNENFELSDNYKSTSSNSTGSQNADNNKTNTTSRNNLSNTNNFVQPEQKPVKDMKLPSVRSSLLSAREEFFKQLNPSSSCIDSVSDTALPKSSSANIVTESNQKSIFAIALHPTKSDTKSDVKENRSDSPISKWENVNDVTSLPAQPTSRNSVQKAQTAQELNETLSDARKILTDLASTVKKLQAHSLESLTPRSTDALSNKKELATNSEDEDDIIELLTAVPQQLQQQQLKQLQQQEKEVQQRFQLEPQQQLQNKPVQFDNVNKVTMPNNDNVIITEDRPPKCESKNPMDTVSGDTIGETEHLPNDSVKCDQTQRQIDSDKEINENDEKHSLNDKGSAGGTTKKVTCDTKEMLALLDDVQPGTAEHTLKELLKKLDKYESADNERPTEDENSRIPVQRNELKRAGAILAAGAVLLATAASVGLTNFMNSFT